MTAKPDNPDRQQDELDDEGPLEEDLQAPEEDEQEPTGVCPACGAALEEDADRCGRCGRPVAKGCMRWWLVLLVVAITVLIVWQLMRGW